MWHGLRTKLAKWLDPSVFDELRAREKLLNEEVNRRVAEYVSRLDPFEPLMKEFSGIFSREFERVEDQLNDQGRTTMLAWAWTQAKDPHFQRITDWIIDTQANETLKRAPVTTERIMYGRAQISGMILLRQEVGRLASLYQKILDGGKGESFSSEITVE